MILVPGTKTLCTRSQARNLSITRPTAATVRITADELILKPLGTQYQASFTVAFDVTLDITVSGFGGLDTGSEAANTWYYIWATFDGTTQSGVLSTSATAPTQPGSARWALVGAVRNDGSSNFIDFIQTGSEYAFVTGQTIVSGNVGLGSWTSFSVAALVPAGISNYVYGAHNFYIGAGMTNNNADSATLTTYPQNSLFNADASGCLVIWFYSIMTANTLYWQSAAADQKIVIRGFRINKLPF